MYHNLNLFDKPICCNRDVLQAFEVKISAELFVSNCLFCWRKDLAKTERSMYRIMDQSVWTKAIYRECVCVVNNAQDNSFETFSTLIFRQIGFLLERNAGVSKLCVVQLTWQPVRVPRNQRCTITWTISAYTYPYVLSVTSPVWSSNPVTFIVWPWAKIAT